MKNFLIVLLLSALGSAPAVAAQLRGPAECTASSRTIVAGLNNDTSTVSSIIISNNGVPYNLSSSQYSKTADEDDGEPHTITLTQSAVSDMSAKGVSFGDSSQVKIVTSNFTHLLDCK